MDEIFQLLMSKKIKALSHYFNFDSSLTLQDNINEHTKILGTLVL